MSLSYDSKVSLSLRTFNTNFSKMKDASENDSKNDNINQVTYHNHHNRHLDNPFYALRVSYVWFKYQFDIEHVFRSLRISNYESSTKNIKENNPKLNTAKDLLKLDKSAFEEVLIKAGVKKGHRLKLIK